MRDAQACHAARMPDADRSVRDLLRPLLRIRQYRHFTDEPPTEEQLDAIAEVARWTGSGRNSQPWRFIVVRDRAVLRRIQQAGMPQTRSLVTAPTAIVIALREPDNTSDAFDEGRAAERMLIAAQALGLGAGIAWAVPGIRPLVAELLGIPQGWFVRTLVVVGHPTEEARRPKSAPGTARLPREQTVFEERWPAD